MAALGTYSPEGWGISAGVSGKPRLRTMPGRAGSDLSGFGNNFYPSWTDALADFNSQLSSRGAAPGSSIGGVADTSNPFTTMRNVKNPGIDAAAQSVLGEITSLKGVQPDTMVRTTRSQPFADRLSNEFHNFDSDRDGNRSSLADFTSSFMAADPQAKAITDQEIGSVGQFYDGTVRKELDDIAGARRIATAGALTPAIQAVLRNRNMGALLGGNDSYLDQQVLDRAGRLARDAALDNAEQVKGNYLYAREGQNKLLGARSRMLNDYLMRSIVPTETGQRINQNDLSRLYGIGAAENANTNYRVSNPQTELAMKLGLLGDVSRVDLGNTFYGLNKPYEPNTSGYMSGMPNRWNPGLPNGPYQPDPNNPYPDQPDPLGGPPNGNPNGNPNGGGNPSPSSAADAILNRVQPTIVPVGTSTRQNPDGTYSSVRDPYAGQYIMDPSWGIPQYDNPGPQSYDQAVFDNTGWY